jgi:hypothetical protein
MEGIPIVRWLACSHRTLSTDLDTFAGWCRRQNAHHCSILTEACMQPRAAPTRNNASAKCCLSPGFHRPKTSFRIMECDNAQQHKSISFEGISFHIAKNNL